MARSLRFWLALGLSAIVAVATVTVVTVLLGVLLPRLNEQVENSNRALGVALPRQVDDLLRGSLAQLARLAEEIESEPAAPHRRTRLILDTLVNAHASLDALYVLDANARMVEVGLPLKRREDRGDLLGLDFSARDFIRTERRTSTLL